MSEYKFFYGGLHEHQVTSDLAEEMFGMESDPKQLQVSPQRDIIWSEKFPKSLLVATHNNNIIGFVFSIPTNKQTMNDFLEKTITEEELAKQVIKKEIPLENARYVYLCSCVVVPEHQRKGIATKMYQLIFEDIPKDAVLFSWPWSKQGKKLIEKIEKTSKRKIHLR